MDDDVHLNSLHYFWSYGIFIFLCVHFYKLNKIISGFSQDSLNLSKNNLVPFQL